MAAISPQELCRFVATTIVVKYWYRIWRQMVDIIAVETLQSRVGSQRAIACVLHAKTAVSSHLSLPPFLSASRTVSATVHFKLCTCVLCQGCRGCVRKHGLEKAYFQGVGFAVQGVGSIVHQHLNS